MNRFFSKTLVAAAMTFVMAASACGSGSESVDGESSATTLDVSAAFDVLDPLSTGSTRVAFVNPEIANVVAYSEPSTESTPVTELQNPRSLPNTSETVPLLFEVTDSSQSSTDWIQVRLPVRPNGTLGWIKLDQVRFEVNPYRIEVNRAEHSFVVYQNDEEIAREPVGIGTGDTKTPVGDFYITELLRPPDPSGPYGTHAFGISGFSETLTEFNGGEGVIGIHGTNDPSSVGIDSSAGCMRLTNETIDRMAQILPFGTPINIV